MGVLRARQQKSDPPERRQRPKERLNCKLSPDWLQRLSNISCFTWKPGQLGNNYTHCCCCVLSALHLSVSLRLHPPPAGILLARYNKTKEQDGNTYSSSTVCVYGCMCCSDWAVQFIFHGIISRNSTVKLLFVTFKAVIFWSEADHDMVII